MSTEPENGSIEVEPEYGSMMEPAAKKVPEKKKIAPRKGSYAHAPVKGHGCRYIVIIPGEVDTEYLKAWTELNDSYGLKQLKSTQFMTNTEK